MTALKKKLILLALSVILVLTSKLSVVRADVNIPSPTGLKYVNDYVGILDKTTSDYLVSVGKEVEDKTGAQSIVVIINSLQGTDIESYAYSLFRSWGIGQKEKNNGLLILLAMENRRWRVEVGKGLEGAVTDISSARVMDYVAQTYFRGGSYGEGIRSAYSSFADSIAKEYGVTLEKNVVKIPYNTAVSSSSGRGSAVRLFLILGVFLVDLIFNRGRFTRSLINILLWGSFFRGGRGGRNGGGYGGGGFGGGGGYGGFGGGESGGGGSSGGW